MHGVVTVDRAPLGIAESELGLALGGLPSLVADVECFEDINLGQTKPVDRALQILGQRLAQRLVLGVEHPDAYARARVLGIDDAQHHGPLASTEAIAEQSHGCAVDLKLGEVA